MATPEPKRGQLFAENDDPQSVDSTAARDSSGKVPVSTLAARRADAVGSIKQAELERKFGEELRWQKKQAEHYQQEWELARSKRKEVEQLLHSVQADLESQLKEAHTEIDELKNRGGERGTRAELETVRRQVDALKHERDCLAAKLADSIEQSGKASGRSVPELREKLAAVAAEKLALEEKLAAAVADRNKVREAQAAASAAAAAAAASHAQELQSRDEEFAALRSRVESLEGQVAANETSAASAAAELAACREDAAVARQAAEVSEAAAAAAMSTAEARAREISTLQSQLVAANTKANAAQEVVAVRAALKAAQSDAAAAWHANATGGASGATLERTQRELSELQAEYARAVYDMARAKAEHSEMAGKLAKALSARDALHNRFAALQIAHTEVELAAKLALDDVASGGGDVTRGGDASAPTVTAGQLRGTISMPEPGSAPVRDGSSGGGSEDGGSMLRSMTLARRQLERVRQLASDALQAADKRLSEAELKRSVSAHVPRSSVSQYSAA